MSFRILSVSKKIKSLALLRNNFPLLFYTNPSWDFFEVIN